MAALTEWTDDLIGRGVAASRPAAGIKGRLYIATDTNAISRDNGTTWDAVTVGSTLTVKDEGGALTTDATTLDFVGAGVVASGTGATKTITIAGASSLTVEDADASPTDSAITKIVFPEGSVSISSHIATIRDVPQAFIGAKARRSTASFGTGAYAAVSWPSADDWDTDGFHDPSSNNSRMTIPAGLGGKYLVSWGLIHANAGYSYIQKNGATVAVAYAYPAGSAGTLATTGVSVLDLAAGDYIEVMLNVASGNLSSDSHFEIVKLDSGKVGAGIGAHAYNNGTQSIPNNTVTAITFGLEEFDTDAFHDVGSNTSRFTIPAGLGGKYLLTGGSTWATGHTTDEFGFRKNGSTLLHSFQGAGLTTATNVRVGATAIVDLVAGDYVELVAYQSSGGAINIGFASGGDNVSWMAVARLDSGGGSQPAAIGAKAYRSTTQGSLAASTYNSIILNGAEDFDTHAFHDLSTNPSRFTVPAGYGGKYALRGNVAVNQAFYIGFKKNGTSVGAMGPYAANFSASHSEVLDLVPGDYVELFEYHSSGTGTAASTNADDRPTMSVMRLGS